MKIQKQGLPLEQRTYTRQCYDCGTVAQMQFDELQVTERMGPGKEYRWFCPVCGFGRVSGNAVDLRDYDGRPEELA